MAELAGDDRERLRRLAERLDAAAQRAERLLAESVLSAAAAPAAAAPPPVATAAPARDDPAENAPAPARDARTQDGPASADPGSTDPERPPPAGWQQPRAEPARAHWLDSDELDLLLAVAAGVRDRIPPELRRRLADAVRELLMALRAVIDWYLERTERPATAGGDVQDIPIL